MRVVCKMLRIHAAETGRAHTAHLLFEQRDCLVSVDGSTFDIIEFFFQNIEWLGGTCPYIGSRHMLESLAQSFGGDFGDVGVHFTRTRGRLQKLSDMRDVFESFLADSFLRLVNSDVCELLCANFLLILELRRVRTISDCPLLLRSLQVKLRARLRIGAGADIPRPVSYTHLTLP